MDACSDCRLRVIRLRDLCNFTLLVGFQVQLRALTKPFIFSFLLVFFFIFHVQVISTFYIPSFECH